MLKIERLRKSFGDRVALEAVSLEVRCGEILGLLGPNGAGKTTLVKLIAGLLTPDAGAIHFAARADAQTEAHAAAGSNPQRMIGLAPQTDALYPELTAAENVAYFAKLYGLHGSALAARVDEALEHVALSSRRDDRAATYSGGMRRRLNLAIALVHRPELLICDEPTAGVDPQSRSAIVKQLKQLRERGMTLLYTTHYIEEAAQLCDRIVILDRGVVRASGTVRELVSAHGGGSEVLVRRGGELQRVATTEPLARLAELYAEHPGADFELRQPNLERAFLNLTGRELRE